jgi:hypothetical protein
MKVFVAKVKNMESVRQIALHVEKEMPFLTHEKILEIAVKRQAEKDSLNPAGPSLPASREHVGMVHAAPWKNNPNGSQSRDIIGHDGTNYRVGSQGRFPDPQNTQQWGQAATRWDSERYTTSGKAYQVIGSTIRQPQKPLVVAAQPSAPSPAQAPDPQREKAWAASAPISHRQERPQMQIVQRAVKQ